MCPLHDVEGKDFAILGIYAKNREEWGITDLACMRSDVTIVPVYESLGADALGFIIRQTELTTMCIEKKSIDLMIKLKTSGKIPGLMNLICFDNDVTEEEK